MYITHFASTAAKYGDMCIVDFDNYKIMIDGGKTKNDSLKLKTLLTKHLHCFILSHWHDDHYGFLNFALRGKRQSPKTYFGYGSNQIIVKENKDVFIESGLDKMVILPKQKKQNVRTKIYSSHLTSNKDENDNSLVTVIKCYNVNYFSFGDATPESISSYNKEIFNLIRNSDNPIIKLPHHGSKDNCIALLKKIKCDENKGRYIISGLGGNDVFDTVNAVLGVESNYLYWVAKYDSNYCKTSAFQQAQINYGNRFVFTNRVTVNPDGSISYF